MPGMDGIEVARRVVGEHGVPVLILTAFSQRNLIEEARDAGVAAYLVKPFQSAEIVPAIEVALARFTRAPGDRGRGGVTGGPGRGQARDQADGRPARRRS